MNAMAIETIRLLGGNGEAARFFGVTTGAISQWKTTGLPAGRELQLLRNKPEVYVASSKLRSADTPERLAA